MPLARHQSGLEQIAGASHKARILALTPPRVSGLWPGFESRARAVTVHFHDRGIGHGAFHIRLAADRIKAFLPDTGLDPVAKALEDGVAFAKFFEPIAPGAVCAHDSQHGLCKPSACSRLLALHRQACPGSARPSVPIACRSILIFPWRNCCTKGRFSTGLNESGLCGPPHKPVPRQTEGKSTVAGPTRVAGPKADAADTDGTGPPAGRACLDISKTGAN